MNDPAALMVEAVVPSPCIDICRLDTLGLCVGCRRTGGEIAEWSSATAARRREIIRQLAGRPGGTAGGPGGTAAP